MATLRLVSESNVRQLGPLSAGSVRPSGPCCLGVAEAPFLSLESSKTATFLVGSESNVSLKSARHCGAKRVSKSKCTKHISSGPLLEVEMSKKCTPLWREAHFQVKMYKAPQLRNIFGSFDAEKVHAVVARSTFPSQNVENTLCSDHFWKLRCRKSAHRCGAKHFPSQNVKNTRGSDHFWRLRWRFAWQAQGIVHLVKSEQNVRFLSHFQLQPPLHYSTLHYTALQLQLRLDYIPLHDTTLHYTHTPLHYNHTTLHSTTLHSTTLHSTTLQYTPLHSTTLRSVTLHYITLHYIPLHHTTLTTTTTTATTTTILLYTTLHCTTLY